MSKRQAAWWFWAVGSTLIALSWFDVVSYEVGWFGFAIGMLGSILGWGIMPPPSENNPPPSAQSDDLEAKSRANEIPQAANRVVSCVRCRVRASDPVVGAKLRIFGWRGGSIFICDG